tara:strand:- start:6398 stop:7075 length:678 start_codon:yes stop_codon:yes gene_type:complete
MNKIRTQISLPKSWFLEHKKHFDLESLCDPIDYICDEYLKNKKIAPEPQNIFKAFELCTYQETKVVIFGQDPYFQDGLANGLAFSVSKHHSIPASLKNIYKEIKNDIGFLNNKNGSLETWALQGVLLLNSCLTVEVSKPGSHLEIGWEKFIKEIIYLLNKKNNLVFFLWGKNAQKYKKYIDSNSHLILTAAHPSPLSAYKGFFGCEHFSKCNDYLKLNRIKEINW